MASKPYVAATVKEEDWARVGNMAQGKTSRAAILAQMVDYFEEHPDIAAQILEKAIASDRILRRDKSKEFRLTEAIQSMEIGEEFTVYELEAKIKFLNLTTRQISILLRGRGDIVRLNPRKTPQVWRRVQ